MWCKYNYFFLKKSAFCCFFFNISRSVQTGFIVRGSSPDQNITEDVVMGVGIKSCTCSIQIPFRQGFAARRRISSSVQPGCEEMK